MSLRRACHWLGVHRSTIRYRCRRDNEQTLTIRKRVGELAEKHVRYGYRRLTTMLRREGFAVNDKRIHRICKQERLQVGRKPRRRKGMPQRVKRMEPFRPGQIWSMDFMHDATVHGRKLRILNVIDEASRQCLASIPEHGYPSWKLVMALDHLVQLHGSPQVIMSDNGPEFVSRKTLKWMLKRNIRHILIEPGKPNQNAWIESFNGRMRDECLNLHLFEDLRDADRTIGQWKDEYNSFRPHSSLGNLTPDQYAATFLEPNAAQRA